MLISVLTEVYLDADKEEDMITIEVELDIDYDCDYKTGITFEISSFECEKEYKAQIESLIDSDYYEYVIMDAIRDNEINSKRNYISLCNSNIFIGHEDI